MRLVQGVLHSLQNTLVRMSDANSLPVGFPYFRTEPKTKAIEIDHTALLVCDASGNPDPTIIWYKDNQPVDINNARYTVLRSGSLQISMSTEEDGGKYECVAENTAGTAFSILVSLYVRVRRVRPRFSIAPNPVYEVMPGENLNISCVAVGSPMPYVQWKKLVYNTKAYLVSAEDMTDNLISKNVLVLVDIQQSSNYTCQAQSTLGLVTQDVQIKVQGVNSVQTVDQTDAGLGGQNGSRIHGQAGMTARIPCIINDKKGNETVVWIRKRDVHILTVGRFSWAVRFSVDYEEHLNSWTLVIRFAQVRDTGTYECQLSSTPTRSISSTLLITKTPAIGVPYDEHYDNATAYYSMGNHTLKIPMTLHQENRERLVARLRACGDYAPGSVVLLQGGENAHRPGSADINYVFRQESYFHWAFGVLEPGWYGSIDISNGRTTLFMPRLLQEYAMWEGRIRTPEEFRRQYQVDEVRYVDEIAQVLKEITSGELLTLHGINSDSKRVTFEATFDGIGNFTVNNLVLHNEIAECRVHKTEAEIRVMRYAASVSCAAHREVMRKIRPGMKEYQLESIFQHQTYYHGGCRHHAYGNICGSGPSAAILHYGHAGAPNDRTIEDGDAIMLDMGAEYYCYASDVSVSYPANGKFSDDHKIIYNAVLSANQAVAAALKPGVSWVDMQSVAYRTMLLKLKEAGLVQGEIDEMMKANIGSIFMPHGLGHLIGIDVHDVGGYLEEHPSRPEEAGYSKLRTARIIEENMVLTIEPGCYFIDYIIDKAFANPKQARFMVSDELERFRGFGGVRIEDDVLVTANGIENLSHELPRTVEDIEALMAAGRKQEDDCNLQ